MQEINNAKQESSAQGIVKTVRESPKLIVLCGPSHAGKSTLAKEISEVGENFSVISPDEMRKRLSISFGDPEHEEKVWDIYESMKCKALREGRSVILDA